MLETSIIIPVRNQKDTLLAALDSLRRQIRKPRIYEIVICDDDSTDGTGDIVKKLRFPIFFKYFINKPSLGRAGNRDQGVARSVGKRVIFLDGDMVPDNNFIANMVEENDSGYVKMGKVLPPPDRKMSGIEEYLYTRGRYTYTEDGAAIPGRYFTSNNFCISRDLYQKVGGLDTKFTGWGGEDMDFGLRLEKSGIPIKNSPRAITYHHHERTLRDIIADFYEFGRLSFPYLIEKHPDLLDRIPSNKLGIPDSKGKIKPIDRLVSALAVNKVIHGLIYKFAAASPDKRWPDYLYDYLLWGSLALGYKKGPRK